MVLQIKVVVEEDYAEMTTGQCATQKGSIQSRSHSTPVSTHEPVDAGVPYQNPCSTWSAKILGWRGYQRDPTPSHRSSVTMSDRRSFFSSCGYVTEEGGGNMQPIHAAEHPSADLQTSWASRSKQHKLVA